MKIYLNKLYYIPSKYYIQSEQLSHLILSNWSKAGLQSEGLLWQPIRA